MKTWKNKLQSEYGNFETFKDYSDVYGVCHRLGFNNAQEAWDNNPMIGGSVNPCDFGIVKKGEKVLIDIKSALNNVKIMTALKDEDYDLAIKKIKKLAIKTK
jgi:uroporphyrinogen-III decarboxylase